MKKFLLLFLVPVLLLAVVACHPTTPTEDDEDPVEDKIYTVIFEADGARHATAKVKEGEKVTQTIADPGKDGYTFVGWFLGEEQVDLATYVVNKNVTFTAKFEEIHVDDSLNVNAVKEADHIYYVVVGWWEVIGTNTDGSPKQTSYLTETNVRVFYANVIKYLTKAGATSEQIANIQFRNYSSAKVDEMGAAINADGDVDLVIGVGNNINSTAGVSLLHGNDSKVAVTMGTTPTSRYVANPATANEVGVNLFDWIKNTQVGKDAFNRDLEDAEIEVYVAPEINVEVTVHGDTDVVTTLTDSSMTVDMPEFTAPAGKELKGLAFAADAEEAAITNTSNVKYEAVAEHVVDGKVALYPVYGNIPVVEEDLIVYVQVNGTNLTMGEFELLKARFLATVDSSLNISFNYVEGNATAFNTALEGKVYDVLIGGNTPINNYDQHAEGTTATAGAKHFKNTSRKVNIAKNTQHLELAKQLYAFVTAEAPAYKTHVTFWTKGNTWVTVDEEANIKTMFAAQMVTFMGQGEVDMAETYNVTVEYYDATNTKVADLGAETLALQEGKGTDIIVGCGTNVTSTGLVPTISIEAIPAALVAGSRQVALCTSNVFAEVLRAMLVNYVAEVVEVA